MNAIYLTVSRCAVTLLLMIGSGAAAAATYSGAFLNDAEMNNAFLFSDDVNELEFLDVSFGRDMSAWHVDIQTPAQLVFSGPTVQPLRGLLRLSFEYTVGQVSFQWAEVLFDGVDYAVQQSGSLHFDTTQPSGAQWSATNVFSSANAQFIDGYFSLPAATAVPLPNSVALMLSALAVIGFIRRGDNAGSALHRVWED